MPEESPLPGIGTLVNVATVLVGALLGLVLGNRLPQRTRELVTDALGLVTLLIAAVRAIEVLSPELSAAVGRSAQMLRSEARRVGTECVSTCVSRWSQHTQQKKKNRTQ